MQILTAIQNTKNYLISLRKKGKTIGFVPTMGALHRGHISLLERAKRENDIAVASIFVNPLQFNDKKDLEKYPQTLVQDIEKLQSARCDVLFTPAVDEMYPLGSGIQHAKAVFDLGMLDKVMEGKHRPGHFQGVCVAVKKLFDIVEPNKAYFGEKDFQQLAIIEHIVKSLDLKIEIISHPTVRDTDGLAMSSRNALLTSDERKNAAHIYKTMIEAREKIAPILKGEMQQLPLERGAGLKLTELKKWVQEKINKNPFLQLEYFEIVNSETLTPVQDWNETKSLRACIAVKVGTVRLIDNISL